MRLLTGIAVICVALQIGSMQSTQSLYEQFKAALNTDQIFFEDNIPKVVKPSNVNNNQVTPSQYLQPPLEDRTDPSKTISVAQQISGNDDFKGITEDPKVPFLDETTIGVANFSINLWKKITMQKSGNSIVSPYSIAIILSLLQQGATGMADEELTNVLQMPASKSAGVYKLITDEIKNRISKNVLKSANNIFLSDTFNLNTRFQQIAQEYFQGGVTPLGFGNSQLAEKTINDWVSFNTNQQIDKILKPGSVDENTQMVLVNAIYFKGLWDIPFRAKLTKPGDFRLETGETKTAQFMQTRRYFRVGMDKTTRSKVIILTFAKSEYSMVVILPPEQIRLHDVISMLTPQKLASYHNFLPKDVQLEMPKFNIRSDTDLPQILKQMGITKIFTQDSGLSGLGNSRYQTPQVSSAVHTAMLSIDEMGGTAAASTAFAVVALSYDEPAVTLKVNRPFLAVLWDNTYQLPLFMAKIEDPGL